LSHRNQGDTNQVNSDRKINTDGGNYNEQIKGDYHENSGNQYIGNNGEVTGDGATIAGEIEKNNQSQNVTTTIEMHNHLQNQSDSKEIENNANSNEKLIKISIEEGKKKVFIQSPHSVENLKMCLEFITEYFNCEVEEIETGSIRFILKGSEQGLKKIVASFKSEELVRLLKHKFNLDLENAQLIDSGNSQENSQDSGGSQRLLIFTIAGNIDQSKINSLKASLIDNLDNKESSHRHTPIKNKKFINNLKMSNNNKINTNDGNYNEHIKGNYYEIKGNYYENSRNQDIDNNSGVIGDGNTIEIHNNLPNQSDSTEIEKNPKSVEKSIKTSIKKSSLLAVLAGGSFFILTFIGIASMNILSNYNNQGPPKTLSGSWKTIEGDAQISFKVKDDLIKDLKILYQYGDSPHCQLKDIQIKQANDKINEIIPIKENSFSFLTPAEYIVDGIPIRDKRISIEGTFDPNDYSVKGKLDLVQLQTLKNQESDNSVPCVESRKSIPWKAGKK